MSARVVSLFIDNFDSYSYNIVSFLSKVNGVDPIVIHPGEVSFDEFLKSYYERVDNVVISPGYGNPETNTNDGLVREMLRKGIDLPILGICYGHQLICHYYGCKIERVHNLFHGHVNTIYICKCVNGEKSDLFNGINSPFKGTCYNSLKVNKNITDVLSISCYSIYLNEYIVMGTQHKTLPYYSVQYHPESVESEHSLHFFLNFKNITLMFNKNKALSFNSLEIQLSKQFFQNGRQKIINKDISSHRYSLKIIKIIGVHKDMTIISYDLFKNIFYNPNDICFWFDSNNQLLYKSDEDISKGEQQHQSSHESDFPSEEVLTNSRFSYMGDTKGILSEIVEYYYVRQEKDKEHYDGIILKLGKRINDSNTYQCDYMDDKTNCHVHYLSKRIKCVRKDFTIDFAQAHMQDLLTINTEGERKHSKSCSQSDCTANDCAQHRGSFSNFPFSDYQYGRYFSKEGLEEDDFVSNSLDSCLCGYFGFLTYEYKYETVKHLYGKMCNLVMEKDPSIPVSVFILSQNFIALDMVKNDLYMISIQPEKGFSNEYLKRSMEYQPSTEHIKETSLYTDGDKLSNSNGDEMFEKITYENINRFNTKWGYETLRKIIHIGRNASDEKDANVNRTTGGGELKRNASSKAYRGRNKITFVSSHTREEYMQNVQKCKEHIADGNAYELCLTTKFTGHLGTSFFHASHASHASHPPCSLLSNAIDALDLYSHLRSVNRVSYSCFIHYDRYLSDQRTVNRRITATYDEVDIVEERLRFTIMCLSPEQFLRMSKDGTMCSKPIKGTMRRGETEEEDAKLKYELQNNEKERAENLMIVDLTTNDFHRICQVDTVKVSKLFYIETYTFLHQMVSQITGEIKDGKNFSDALISVFPGGSMTGAPKLTAMSILQSIEKAPRGIYSGAIGFISAEGNFIFNIVIRTAILQNDKIFIGAGGAITIKSDDKDEYSEMLLKFKSVASPICCYMEKNLGAEVEYKI